jgi:phytol kinase
MGLVKNTWAREGVRKAVHLSVGGLLIFSAIYVKSNYSIDHLQYGLFGVFLLSLLGDVIMADFGVELPVYSFVRRRRERVSGFTSSTLMLVGCLLSLQFFDFNVALAAICILVFGDPAAALFGKLFGTPFYRKKSLIGCSAMFVVGIIVGLILLDSFWSIIGMALAGTIAEVFAHKIDDNLVIPLFSGLVGQIILWLL